VRRAASGPDQDNARKLRRPEARRGNEDIVSPVEAWLLGRRHNKRNFPRDKDRSDARVSEA